MSIKGSVRGQLPSRKLFKEFHPEGKESIHEWRERFVACMDITEYSGAIELMGGWPEWIEFKKNWPHFTSSILPVWLEEIEVKLRSQAIMSLANSANKDSSAAKWLAEGKYKEKVRGRPSKAEVEQERKVQARTAKEVDDEVSRVLETVQQGEIKSAAG